MRLAAVMFVGASGSVLGILGTLRFLPMPVTGWYDALTVLN